MIRNAPPKHPVSSKWYWLQWPSDELQNAKILTSSWQVPAGLTLDTEMLSGYRVGVRLSGGVDGEDYSVVNQITTDNSETLHEAVLIRCRTSGH